MPIHKVVGGYKWGDHGKVYPTKGGAEKQMRAAFANGYVSDERLKENKQMNRSLQEALKETKTADFYEKQYWAAVKQISAITGKSLEEVQESLEGLSRGKDLVEGYYKGKPEGSGSVEVSVGDVTGNGQPEILEIDPTGDIALHMDADEDGDVSTLGGNPYSDLSDKPGLTKDLKKAKVGLAHKAVLEGLGLAGD